MRRNLRFWTRYACESAVVELALTAVFTLIVVFGADGLDFKALASVGPYFFCFAAIFTIMMINTGSQSLYVPLLLAMGETRRNVLLGFHYYRALIITVTIALCGLVWLLAPGEVSSIGLRSIPTILCLLIASSALGSIIGTLLVKWRWVGTIFIVLLFGLAGGTMGFTGVAMGDVLAETNTAALAAYLERLPWWLAMTALAAFGLDVAFQWLLLQRQEVKL